MWSITLIMFAILQHPPHLRPFVHNDLFGHCNAESDRIRFELYNAS